MTKNLPFQENTVDLIRYVNHCDIFHYFMHAMYRYGQYCLNSSSMQSPAVLIMLSNFERLRTCAAQ